MHAHHLEIDDAVMAGNDGLGRYTLLPGSASRAARIAARLEGASVHTNRRRLDVHTGVLRHQGRAIDVAVVPTGMGCPSVDIVANELIGLGVRRMLRVGTSGTLQPSVAMGDLVIATAAVRDEAASDAYTPREFPAAADPGWVEALSLAALEMGLGERVHAGVVHTKDSFFGREFGQGPDAERNVRYMEHLVRSGVLASEMEAAHLFVLGAVCGGPPWSVAARRGRAFPLRCGAVLAIVGSVERGFASRAEEEAAEERLISLALGGVGVLAGQEG